MGDGGKVAKSKGGDVTAGGDTLAVDPDGRTMSGLLSPAVARGTGGARQLYGSSIFLSAVEFNRNLLLCITRQAR